MDAVFPGGFPVGKWGAGRACVAGGQRCAKLGAVTPAGDDLSTSEPTPGALVERARAWAVADPEPDHVETVVELVGRVEQGDEEAVRRLRNLFDGRITFGTAGLRAPLGPGPRRMNRLVVRQTTAGLMRWLPLGARVVIGYDARWGSVDMAAEVAAVATGAGGEAEILPRPLPTPVLAATVLKRRADAGVMITASHNPPTDNGYKLYLADGIQLVDPADGEIAAAIDAVVASGVDIPLGADPTVLDESIVDHHLELAVGALVTGHRDVSIVATALHGVGGAHLLAAFERAGFDPPTMVADQFDPDPAFPTVPFPNPEEPGALDEALDLAARLAPDVVMANDPDADRLAIAVPAPDSDLMQGTDPGYRVLTGDELGVLLADHLLRHTTGPRQVATSLVSSRRLEAMAAAHRVRCSITLTGFKWVARPIVEHPDESFVLGYEEAIGYCVGGAVRDKDGISAALVAAEMVAEAIAAGETLWDRLDRLDRDHGIHRGTAVSVRLEGADGVRRRQQILDALVAEPPSHLEDGEGGEIALESKVDLAVGAELPPADGVVLTYQDGTRVIVRPSGTEPKLKAYIEVRREAGESTTGENAAGETWAGQSERMERRLKVVAAAVDALLRG